jgi:RNA polymerase-associated protein LEO1
MSDSEDPIDPIDEGGDDLFGDDDDIDVATSPKPQALDDDDLASDPEEDSRPAYTRDDQPLSPRGPVAENRVAELSTARHHIPRPSDDTVGLRLLPR